MLRGKLISVFILWSMSFASVGMDTAELPGEERVLLHDVIADIDEVEPFNEYYYELGGSILIALGLTGMCVGTLIAGAANLDITNELCQAGVGVASGFGSAFIGGTILYCYSYYASRPL